MYFFLKKTTSILQKYYAKTTEFIKESIQLYSSVQKTSFNTMQEIEVVNVRLPEEVVNQLDLLVETNIYKSRSELIRSLLREHVSENKLNEANK